MKELTRLDIGLDIYVGLSALDGSDLNPGCAVLGDRQICRLDVGANLEDVKVRPGDVDKAVVDEPQSQHPSAAESDIILVL